MDKRKIISVTVGILFDRSFRIMDKWGEIADGVLKESKYFSTDYFPRISSQYNNVGQLVNSDKGHYLSLSTDNLIYRHVFINSFDSEYSEFVNRVVKYLVPTIIHDNQLIVKRLGVVYNYETGEKGIKEFAEKYFKPDIKGIGDFRFSMKSKTREGLFNQTTDDFINKIYTVGTIESDIVGISYDYQHHYIPAQQCIKDKIEQFLKDGNEAFLNDISIEG